MTDIQEHINYNLDQLKRVTSLMNDLKNDMILIDNGGYIKQFTTREYVPTDVVADYDPETDKEIVTKSIEKRLIEIETWYIVLDTRLSIILDKRIRTLIKKHGFSIGNILNFADSHELLIQLEDTNRRK